MRALSTFIGILLLACPSSAEEPATCKGAHSLGHPLPDACLETIDTDRPHQTDTPHVVPPGHAQFESALVAVAIGGAYQTSVGPENTAPHLVLLEDNYKFGLVDHVDLQVIFKHADYLTREQRFAAPGPFNVRVKVNLVEERGWVPAITLVPTFFVPMDRVRALRGGLLIFWGWELPWNFELEMNAGVLLSTRPKPPAVVVLATAVTHPVIGALKGFVDIYATGWDIALGTGLLYPLGRDWQLDAGSYIGVSGDASVATPFLGLSFRR